MSSVINNTDLYNYILTNYVKDRPATRFDTHKKSELRGHYNRIVKSNKDSPLYKIKMDSDDITRFAIDLKENSRNTESLISSLSMDGDDMENVFQRKIATSSDEENVHVDYIGEKGDEPSAASFELGVKSLASPQINTGHYLFSTGRSFESGSYMFDLDTPNNSYEFQFNIMDGDSNLDVQSRIARLINTSDVPINASVLFGENETSALSIFSKQTGLSEDEEYLFNITSPTSWHELELLGISSITSPATNSVFTLNGDERTSLSNTFTINKDFEVTLKSVTPSDAHIGFKSNTDAIADSVEDLAKAYNNFLDTGAKYEAVGGDSQLKMEMSSIYRSMAGELGEIGISTDENGRVSLDRDMLSEAVTGEDSRDAFKTLNRFKDALLRQSQKTAVNPMDYVNKVAVEYKNPGRNFAAPYANSRFAGMLIDYSL